VVSYTEGPRRETFQRNVSTRAESAVNITYDPKTDTLTVVLSFEPVAESDEDKPGVILDYDEREHLVGIEILDASEHVPDLMSMQFRIAG
jgi:uncharacterized protein YuzE